MIKLQLLLIYILLILRVNVCNAQSSTIDSLQKVINTAKADTSKVNTLNELSKQFISSGSEKALDCAHQALKLAEQLNWKKGVGNSFRSIGYYYYIQLNYPATFEYWLKALKIREGLNDKKGISSSLRDIGNVYFYQANYPNTLNYLFFVVNTPMLCIGSAFAHALGFV